MTTTIQKTIDVEIELGYDEICEAVSDLSRQEKLTLVNDCELLNNDAVIDYIDNCDDDDKHEIIESCILITDSMAEGYISNLSGTEFMDLVANTGHEDLLQSQNTISEQDEKLLEVCKKYFTEEQIKVIIEKHEEILFAVKAVIGLVK